MSSDKFDQWWVVEVIGHKKFAGRVTEGPFGLVQVDVPEVTLASGQNLPAFSKLFGAASIYCLTPCTEETARAFARDFRTQAFHSYELPALAAPKIFAPVPAERDPEWDADNDDLEADWDQPSKCNCGDRQVCDVCQNVGSDPLSDRKPDPVMSEEESDEAIYAEAFGIDIADLVAAAGEDVPARDPQLDEELPEALKGSWPAIKPQRPMNPDDDDEPF